MSDAIIIQAVYIAIGPFFVVENAGGDGDGASGGRKKGGDGGNVILKTFGKSAMRGLRLDALALIRSVSCVPGPLHRFLTECLSRFLPTTRIRDLGSLKRF